MNKIFLILLIAVITVQVNARPGDDDKKKEDPATDAAKDAGKDAKGDADKAKTDGADAKKKAAGAGNIGGGMMQKLMKIGGEVVDKIADDVESMFGAPKGAEKKASDGLGGLMGMF